MGARRDHVCWRKKRVERDGEASVSQHACDGLLRKGIEQRKCAQIMVVRTEIAASLKRASLERQLHGIQPNSVQEILEDAIELWLHKHGLLK